MARTSYDQLMKQALQARFADFMRLFDPATAAGLDLDAGVIFRDVETFSDIPQGKLLVADIVAEVRTLSREPKVVVVHVEIQREREAENFPRRMWRYYIALVQREDKPVIPIALLFYGAPEGLARETYEETLFGYTIVTFHYLQISLPRLEPYAYLRTGNVLAAALAAIMGRGLRGAKRAALHVACLQRLLTAARAREVDPATADLLADVVTTYLPTGIEDRTALRLQLQSEEQGGHTMAVDLSQLTWASRREIEVRQNVIREVVQERFGSVSPDVEAAIERSAETDDALVALLRRAATARTESDLLAPLDGGGAAIAEVQTMSVGRPALEATLRTLRQNIKELIEGRFTSISPEVEAVIAGTDDEDELRALFRRAITAPTQRDLLDSDR